MGRKTDVSQLGSGMCSSMCVRAEAARQAWLTAHGCATMCSAGETDVAANPAGWDRNSRGPGSGHDPRGPHPVGLVHEPSLSYRTLAGSRSPGLVLGPWRGHRNRTLDMSTGTGTWTGTSCPTPISGTPGQQLVFGCPRRFHPRATRTFLGSSFLLFSSSSFLVFLAACPPFVFFSFGLSLC
ncbi:hypothetical protein MTO96_023185 [Rhipicephalus appendiculatus]